MWLCGCVAMWLSFKNLKSQNFKLSNFQISNFAHCQFSYFQIVKFPNSRIFKIQIFNCKFPIFNFQNIKMSTAEISKSVVHWLSNIFKVLDSKIYKNNMFQQCVHTFLVFLKYFGIFKSINKGPWGSTIQKSWKC